MGFEPVQSCFQSLVTSALDHYATTPPQLTCVSFYSSSLACSALITKKTTHTTSQVFVFFITDTTVIKVVTTHTIKALFSYRILWKYAGMFNSPDPVSVTVLASPDQIFIPFPRQRLFQKSKIQKLAMRLIMPMKHDSF